MHSKIIDSAPWPFLIGGKLLQVYPVGTVLAVLLAIPSQLALIVAFLLPIKIIMLMGSEGVPRFMPNFAANIDKNILIITLAGFSIAAFIFHHFSNRAIQAIAKSGAYRLDRRNKKLHLFNGQDQFIESSYRRYISTVAALSFYLLGIFLLTLLYPIVATTIISYTIICIIISALVFVQKKKDSISWMNQIQKSIPAFSTVGFFLLFFTIVIDYLYFKIPDQFFVLLLSAILGRQLLNRTGLVTKNIFFFYRQQAKLKALLFHGVALEKEAPKIRSTITMLKRDSKEHVDLTRHLSILTKTSTEDWQLSWADSGIKGVMTVKAENKQKKRNVETQETSLLIKIFDHDRSSEAYQERVLLTEIPELIPCPKLVSYTKITNFDVHIFDITGFSKLEEGSQGAARSEVSKALNKVTLPRQLESRYKRSHTMLWQQINSLKLDHLKIAFSENDQIHGPIDDKLATVGKILQELPLALVNPNLKNRNLYFRNANGNVVFLHWGRWSIEPMGTDLSDATIKELSHEVNPLSSSKDRLPTPSESETLLRISQMSRQFISQLQNEQLDGALATFRSLTDLASNTTSY